MLAAVAAGNPAAEYEMGDRYAEGRGRRRNLPEAARWFERAADTGFAPAQFRLASLHTRRATASRRTCRPHAGSI